MCTFRAVSCVKISDQHTIRAIDYFLRYRLFFRLRNVLEFPDDLSLFSTRGIDARAHALHRTIEVHARLEETSELCAFEIELSGLGFGGARWGRAEPSASPPQHLPGPPHSIDAFSTTASSYERSLTSPSSPTRAALNNLCQNVRGTFLIRDVSGREWNIDFLRFFTFCSSEKFLGTFEIFMAVDSVELLIAV